MIKVSVVVPIYNVEKYINKCVDSLINQTLSDIEIILVNDGSKDSSGMIAKDYSEKYENIILVEQQNEGLSSARNTGMKYVNGKYVYFLDSDDYLADNALDRLFTYAEKYQIEVLKFSAYTFDDGLDNYSFDFDGGYRYRGDYQGIYNGTQLLKLFIKNEKCINPNCGHMFLLTDFIRINNIQFIQGILHEDNLFHLQSLMLSKRASVLNEPLHYRRVREGSIITVPNYIRKIESLCITVQKADELLDSHPEVDKEIIEWYILSYVNVIINYTNHLDFNMKKEVNSYMKSVRCIAKRHSYRGSVIARLYFMCKPLYYIYRDLAEIKQNLMHR